MGREKIALAALLSLICCFRAEAGELKSFSFKLAGYDRVYRVYSPAGLEKDKKYPLVLLLHGGGGTGEGMIRLAKGGFEALADRHGAILAYPDAVDRHWNDYRGDKSRKSQKENVDDAAFLLEMAERISAAYPVDKSRIYASGISNGAMMSHALACRASDRIAAIAPVAGAMPLSLAETCRPARPLPVLMINGTEDKLVHWEGGYVTGPFGRRKLGRILSAEKTRDFWLARGACDRKAPAVSKLDKDPADGTSVRRETYSSCGGGAEVDFIKIRGGGHTWPGGLQYMPRAVIGRTSSELDANQVIWDFFMRHRLPAEGSGSPSDRPR